MDRRSLKPGHNESEWKYPRMPWPEDYFEPQIRSASPTETPFRGITPELRYGLDSKKAAQE